MIWLSCALIIHSVLFVMCFVSRNKQGRVVKTAPFQSAVKSGEVSRIEPNKKWFGKCWWCSVEPRDNISAVGVKLRHSYHVNVVKC